MAGSGVEIGGSVGLVGSGVGFGSTGGGVGSGSGVLRLECLDLPDPPISSSLERLDLDCLVFLFS